MAMYRVRVVVSVDTADGELPSDLEIAESGWEAIKELEAPIVEIMQVTADSDILLGWREVDLEELYG
jgi:hypothetical protein